MTSEFSSSLLLVVCHIKSCATDLHYKEPREGEILDTHTLVDLSGKKDCKYKVSYCFKKTPRNGKLAEVWPASEEENLARLKDAGAPYERGITKCLRCKGEPGILQKN